MSHVLGHVVLQPIGEPLGCFEYDGTSDVAMRAVAPEETVQKNWRTDDNDRACPCSPAVEAPVLLTADYGHGLRWESRVCLTCMTIVGKRSPYNWLGYGEDDGDEPIDCSPRPRALLGAG